MTRPPSEKSAGAYRTISEVAAELDLPQHVLRFWETRFPQLRPLKRAGGRRFYRPADVALLRDIRAKLHGEGYTIKGVQRLLRERGGREPAAAGVINGKSEAEPDEADAGAADAADAAGAAAERDEPSPTEAIPPSALPNPSGPDDLAPSLDALREALALVEACERQLRAALAQPHG